MKNIKVLQLISLLFCLTACSSSNENFSSSLSDNISSGDNTVVKFNSTYEINKSFKNTFGVSLTYSINGEEGEVSFNKENDLIFYTKTVGDTITSKLLKTESIGIFYYEKQNSDFYNYMHLEEGTENDINNELKVFLMSGRSYNFDLKEELTFLNRDSIKYTFSGNDEKIEGSAIVDKESGLLFSLDINEKISSNGVPNSQHKSLTVNELRTSSAAKTLMAEYKNSIKVDVFGTSTLLSFGLSGEVGSVSMPVSNCRTTFNNNSLTKYEITYIDRVNSGNDPYINLFESLTYSLYNIGFNSYKDLTKTDYENLLINSTIDYNADYDFIAYQLKENKTFCLNTSLDISYGQAVLKLEISVL